MLRIMTFRKTRVPDPWTHRDQRAPDWSYSLGGGEVFEVGMSAAAGSGEGVMITASWWNSTANVMTSAPLEQQKQ